MYCGRIPHYQIVRNHFYTYKIEASLGRIKFSQGFSFTCKLHLANTTESSNKEQLQ